MAHLRYVPKDVTSEEVSILTGTDSPHCHICQVVIKKRQKESERVHSYVKKLG